MEDRKLQAARALEQQGQLEAAVKAYVEGGAPEDAARLLAGAERFADAGRLLFGSLGVDAAEAGRLHKTLHGRALHAAILLAKGGESKLAADLFVALDDPEGAVRAYLQHKRYAEAAGLARRLGKLGKAGEIYALAGQAYEAGICFMEADDPQKALEQLRRVPRDHPRYRTACVKAARLAAELHVLGFELEQFFARFVESGPRGEDELSAFYELGQLYLDHGSLHDAQELFEKILAVEPGHRDAAAHLASIRSEQATAAASFDLLPDLPEAPQLPEPTRVVRVEPPPPPAAEGPAFIVGAVVADRYRLEERIGSGGMAVVFRATDLDLGEEIALKVFVQALHDEEASERFKRELKLSRQLSNPHVVRLFDIGSYRGTRYISMELLKGRDLRARLSSPLSNSDALSYLIQVCEGLQAAHDAGVVHRDLKPENCFVTTDGLVKVMDFGIAKVQSAPGLTTTGIIQGTPAYISPEQVNSFSNVTFSADLYSLGVVAYEVFTSRLPFSHAEPMKVLMMHLNDVPTPPRVHNPKVPQDIEAVILKLLEKDPARRFSSCRELAARLQEIRDGLAV